MSLSAKLAITGFRGLPSGLTLAVWIAFGGDVYTAYLGDLVMRCF